MITREVKQMFRYKRGVKADYNRQGYIYFTSRRYRELDEAAQQKISTSTAAPSRAAPSKAY